MRNKPFFSIVFLSLLLQVNAAAAYDVHEVDKLDFGRFGMVNNSAQHLITVHPNGNMDYDGDILPILPGKPARYDLEGLPQNVTFIVGIQIPNPPTEGGLLIDNIGNLSHPDGGQAFSLINPTADNLVTDNDGDATLYIGGTLRTSGNGGVYYDGAYTGQMDVTLFY